VAVSLQRLTGEGQEIAALQRVLEGAGSYAERVTGHPPGHGHGDAQRLFSNVPEGVDYEHTFVWGVLAAGKMVGVVDVIRGWPNPDTALLGPLLLTDAYGGRGLGRRAYAAVEEQVRSWPEIRSLRAAVVATNSAVLPFWERMGFSATGEVRPYRHDKLTSQSIVLTKSLKGVG
jgi:GNAT superfamily N-acetyltransferase